MLLDLLIDASLAVPDTQFARLMRGVDRFLLEMAELDARDEGCLGVHRPRRAAHTSLARLPASRPGSLPSMTTRPEAITSAPAI